MTIRRAQLAITVSLALACLAVAWSTAAADGECSGCSLLGDLSVQLSSVVPLQPLVGDVVTLTYQVDYRLPGSFDCGFSGTCQLQGGDPYLEGDEPPTYANGDIVVQRQAAEAGVAVVELHVSAMTEEQCYYVDPVSGCSSYFQFATIKATSGPLELSLLEATPTPTPTPTPTVAPNRGGGGCAVDHRSAPGGFAVLAVLLVPFLLAGIARVPRRQHRS